MSQPDQQQNDTIIKSAQTICPSEEELNVIHNRVICPVEQCGKLFSNPSAMKMHLAKVHRITSGLSHSQIYDPYHSTHKKCQLKRYYYCPVNGCPRSQNNNRPFNRFSQVKQHYLTIHAEKKYHCTNCTKSFGMADVCKRHQQLCGKLFQCGTCKKRFNKYALLMHLKRTSHQMQNTMDDSKYIPSRNLKDDNNSLSNSCTATTRYHPIQPRPNLQKDSKNENHELSTTETLFSVETQTETANNNYSNRLLVSYGTQTPSLAQIHSHSDITTARLTNKFNANDLLTSDDYVQTTSNDVISTWTQTLESNKSVGTDIPCNSQEVSYTIDQATDYVSSSSQVFDSYYPSTLNGHKNPSLNDVHFNNNIIPGDKSTYTESDLQAARNLSYAELPLHYDVKVQTTLSNLDYTDMIDSGTQTQFSAIDGEELRKFLDSIDNIDLEMSDGRKCKCGLSNCCQHVLKENITSANKGFVTDSRFSPLLDQSKDVNCAFTVDSSCQTMCNNVTLTEAETQTLSNVLDNAMNEANLKF